MTIRNYANNAATTTLSSGISDSDTSATIADATGWPTAPFTIYVDSEVIYVGGRSGTSLSSMSRGYDSTTAASHSGGATVDVVVIAEDFTWDAERNLNFGKVTTDTPDDNFDTGSLDGKWTVVDGGSGTVDLLATSTTGIYDLATRSRSMLAQGEVSNALLLRQDYTLPDGNSIVLSFSPNIVQDSGISDNEIWCGIGINDSDTNQFGTNTQYIFLDANASTYIIRHSSANGPPFNTLGTTIYTPIGGKYYVRFLRDGLDYYGFLSTNGSVWTCLGSRTASSAYNNIWLFVSGNFTGADPVPIQEFHWIRQGGSGQDPW